MRRVGTDLMATGVILGSVAAGAVATLAMVGASDRRAEEELRRTVIHCETSSASQAAAESRNEADASGIAVKVSGSTITVSEHGSQRGRKKRRCRRIVMPPSEIPLSAMVRAARAAAAVSESAANREVAQERLIRLKQARAVRLEEVRARAKEVRERAEEVRARAKEVRERAEEVRAQADMAGKRMTIRCKSLEATASKSGFSCWTGPASKR